MMNTDWSSLITLSPIILIAIFIVIYLLCQQRDRKKVFDSSAQLRKLIELNQNTHFEDAQGQIILSKSLDTKPKYDRFNLSAFLDDSILNNADLRNSIESIKKNQKLYEKYKEDIGCLSSEITEEEAKKMKLPYKRYLRIEHELFLKNQLYPTLDCKITCIAKYVSPKGQNHYSKKEDHSTSDILSRYDRLLQYEIEQNSEENRRKRERSKMSDKLRYSIMRRDGFKCVLCGRKADDGIKLHVDHIIPVARGGTTVESNLRTLCEDCNWGKSDSLE